MNRDVANGMPADDCADAYDFELIELDESCGVLIQVYSRDEEVIELVDGSTFRPHRRNQ
jgi:hypothetical protein